MQKRNRDGSDSGLIILGANGSDASRKVISKSAQACMKNNHELERGKYVCRPLVLLSAPILRTVVNDTDFGI